MAYLFTLLCPLFTSGASFLIAHEYWLRKVNVSLSVASFSKSEIGMLDLFRIRRMWSM